MPMLHKMENTGCHLGKIYADISIFANANVAENGEKKATLAKMRLTPPPPPPPNSVLNLTLCTFNPVRKYVVEE